MKRVLFVSNLRKSDDSMTSTDIMTLNIIKGISGCGVQLDLFILYDDEKEVKPLKSFYAKFCQKMFYAKRLLHEGQSKYKSIFLSLFLQMFKNHYFREIKKTQIKSPYDVIICNKITIDEIIFGKILKKNTNSRLLYEYWSDPMALSGINSEIFKKMPRKWAFRLIEKRAIKNCDKIIYGTKILYLTQKEFYKKEASRMAYIDIAYCESKSDKSDSYNANSIIYAGNYYSTIRNINELIKAISSQNKYTLDIFGNSDLKFENTHNITFHGRVSKNELDFIKNNYSTEVCILNKNTPQIPGKIFYDMMSKKTIIILADGPMQNEIIEYLSRYKRFLVCKNRDDDILELLSSNLIVDYIPDYSFLEKYFSPMTISKSLIDGGMN